MPYFNYHATVRRLLREGRLTGMRLVENYRGISPALLLFFDDPRHPVMPIREHRFDEYFTLLHALYPRDAPMTSRQDTPPEKGKYAKASPAAQRFLTKANEKK